MTEIAARTVILGTGLIGASLAAAGRRAGALTWVVGVGRKRPNLELALARGAVDEVSQDPAAALARADLAVLAAPADACVDLLATVARHAPAECLVTDVASVKVPLCQAAERVGLARRFVGGHPIAGSESSGASAADPELFRGRVVVLTPEAAPEAAVTRVRALWEQVGGTVVSMDARLHDEAVAASSHLPHMIAFALCAALAHDPDVEIVKRLAGSGLRDMTRLGASDPAMWRAIVALNRGPLREACDRFSVLWNQLCDAIAHGDAKELERLMEEARGFRRALRGR
jgi:prephenate dehydrogenase